MNDKDVSMILRYISDCSKMRLDALTISVTEEQYNSLTKDKGAMLGRILCLADYLPNCSYSYNKGKISVTGLVVKNDPRYDVKNRKEIIDAMLDAGKKEQRRFRLVMTPELLKILMDDNGKELKLLEQDLYVQEYSRTGYAAYGLLCYDKFYIAKEHRYHTEKTIEASSQKIGGLFGQKKEFAERRVFTRMEDVIHYVESETAKLTEAIVLFCTPELYKALLSEGTRNKFGGTICRILDLLHNAGIMNYKYMSWEYNHRINIDNIEYYAGYKVACAVKRGSLGILSTREQQLLSVATKLVQSISASNPADKVVMISHEIGKMTQYVIDETTEDDDCAYGPLLLKKANCDGYSDAFFLCATLAGINVRFQYGDKKNIDKSDRRGSLHIWNLVNIRNQWLSVDVTWDSHENKTGLEWRHCMIGKDRLECLYRWNHDMTPGIAERTDYHRSGLIHEFFCSSLKDAAKAVCNAKAHKTPVIYLFFTNLGIIKGEDDIIYCLREAGIHKSCQYRKIEELNALRLVLNY